MTVIRLLALAGLLLTSSLTIAQPKPPQTANQLKDPADAAMRQLGAAFVQESPHVGLSVGIVRNGQPYFYNFGTTEKGRRQLPTAQTRYESASVSKTFTSLLLAQAVVEKKVKLTDDIRRYLPGSYPNLAFEGQPIKLVDLANTTSGLPDNLPEWAAAGQGAPSDSTPARLLKSIQGYTKARFYQYLHTVRLTDTPGAVPRHSNVAAQLLGHLLEDIYHTPYEQLVRQYIERPLQMANGFAIEGKAGPLATGYNENGRPMPLLAEATALQAAAGLKYSTADMLKYLQYQVAEKDAAVRLSHQPAWGNPDSEAMALNWQLDRTIDRQRKLQTSGGAFGFASFCVLYPDTKLGIVLLANESDPATQEKLEELSEKLLVALRGIPPAQQALESSLRAADYQQAFEVVQTVKQKHPELHLTEDYVNTWGYQLARAGQLKQALALFKLNVRLFPTAWNTYDSLAETYALLGDRAEAIANYRRSLALNPKNENGAEQLKKLEADAAPSPSGG